VLFVILSFKVFIVDLPSFDISSTDIINIEDLLIVSILRKIWFGKFLDNKGVTIYTKGFLDHI
jgi:hypothetical protein